MQQRHPAAGRVTAAAAAVVVIEVMWYKKMYKEGCITYSYSITLNILSTFFSFFSVATTTQHRTYGTT